MKKSCERIAAVLGIQNQRNPSTSPNVDNLQRSSAVDAIHNKSPIKPEAVPVNLGNMNDPAAAYDRIRSRSPGKDGQPSGYKSLREKSPMKPPLTSEDLNTGEAPTATKFASVSQTIQRFDLMALCIEHGETEFDGFEGASRKCETREGSSREILACLRRSLMNLKCRLPQHQH